MGKEEEEVAENVAETAAQEKVASVVSVKRERSLSPPSTTENNTHHCKKRCVSPSDGTTQETTEKSKATEEAPSPDSSKDGDSDLGSAARNRSLEALFKVTDSELQSITSKVKVPIIATEALTSSPGSVQEVHVSVENSAANTVVEAVEAISTTPPSGEVEMVQIVTVVPEDMITYQYLNADNANQKFQLKSDSSEDHGYQIVYVNPDNSRQMEQNVHLAYPAQTVYQDLQVVQNPQQPSSSPSTPSAATPNQEIARKRKYSAQKPGRHICPYCSRGCAKPSVLEKHIRAHTNERPYPCVPCGFSFKTKSNLYKHCKSRAHAIKIGHSAASIDEMDLNKSTDKDDIGEGSDISESELDGDDGGTHIEMMPPARRLDSQGQSTDSDCAAALSVAGLYTGRVSMQSEAPSTKHDEVVIITDIQDKTASSNWQLQRPNVGQITKSHSFTMHQGEDEKLLFSSGSFDSAAAGISRAEKQSKFLLRSASEPSKSMTPEMLNQRISALISANDAVLSTPMADPPRPKRLSRQNSENKEYTQPRLLLQQGYQQPAGNVVMVSSNQIQTEGVRIMPKPQVVTPVPQEQYYIIGDHVGMSSQMQVPRLELATPVEMERQRPQEIKIQIQLPKPETRAPTREGVTTISRSSSVIKDLLLRNQSPSQVAVVPTENQPNIRRMLSAPQMSQPKIDHIVVEEIEGGHLVIADSVEVDLLDQSHSNAPYLAADRLDTRGHISRAKSLEISASGIPHFGRLHASSSLSLSSIPGALQRSASLGHHPGGSNSSLSQPNLAQMTSFQRQTSTETPPNQSHASSHSLQKLRGKILMRRSMSAERVVEDESIVKPDTPKISLSKQVTTPQKRKEAYKSTSLGRSSLTSSLKQASVERQPSVEKQVSFDIDGEEKQKERRSKTDTKDDYDRLHVFSRTQSEPAMGLQHSGEQMRDELAMPVAVAIQPEPRSDLVGQSLLGLLPMPPREVQDVVATGKKVISVSLPGSSQQAFILPVNQSFQFFRQPRLAIAPLHLGRMYGNQMVSTSPSSSFKFATSPKDSPNISPVKEPGKIVMRVPADLKSSSIHNLPPEKAMSLLLLGHNYPSLRMSSNLSFCSLQGTQPMYVPIGSSNKISMYSNWKTASHNPNPMGLSSKALFSLYRTRKWSSREYFVTAPTQAANTGVLTHSSAWNFFNNVKTPAQRNMTAPVISSQISPSKVKPDLITSPQRAKDDSNILMTKMTKFIKLPQVTKQASLDENALRRNSENRELKRSLSEMVTPKRVKIFKGGWKSEEEYIYVRGRGRGKYVCEECGIRCKKPSMLKKHIRTHTDVRPYVCKHCSFSFKTKGNLTKHMKSKTHQRKCVELGVLPVPICIDDSQIDLEALARQARLTKAQKDLEDEVGMNSDDDGEDDDDDDDDDGDDGEDMEIDDEEETRESVNVLSSLEMAEPDHEEEVVTVETPEKTRANAAPAYVAIRGEQGNQPTFAKVILDGEKISEQRLGTIYGYRTKHGTDKGDDASRQTIDDEIARSLLDLSKGAEQSPGGDDSQDSQGEKQGERLGSLIGALIDRTAMTKGDSPVKVIIQQEGGEQVIIERTPSPMAADKNEVKKTDDASKSPAAASSSVQFIFTPDSTSKSGAGTIRITHSGFVPPIFFSKEAAKEMSAKNSGPTEKEEGSGSDAVQALDKKQRVPTAVETAKGIWLSSGGQTVNSGPIIGQMVRPILLPGLGPNVTAATSAVPVITSTISSPRLSPQSQASNPFRDKRKAESFEQVSPPKRPRTLSPFSRCSERPMLGGKRPGLVRQISVDIADDSMPGSAIGSDTSLMDAGPAGLRQSPSSSGVPVHSVYSHSGLSAPATSVLVRQLSAPLPQVTQNPGSQVEPEQMRRVVRSPSPLTVTTPAIQLVSPQSQIVQVLPPGGVIGSLSTSVQSPQLVLPQGMKPVSIADLTGKSGYIQLLSTPSGQITLLPTQSYFENLKPTSPVLVQSMPVMGEQISRENAERSLADKECVSESRTWHGECHSIEEAMDVAEQRSRSPSRSLSPSGSRSPVGSRSPSGARSPSGSRSPGLDEEPKSQGQKVSKLASSQSPHQRDVTYVTGENSAPFEIKPIPGRVNDEKEALVDGKYVCTTCGKLFTEHHQLTLHKNIHYIERQYRCEDCNISFRTPILLQKHRRSESHHAKLSVNQQFGIPTTDNPRPYRCDDCEVAFRIHGHLAKHLRSKAHIAMLERMGKVPHGTSSRMEHSESDGSLESDPSLDSLRQMIDNANNATLFRNMEVQSSPGHAGVPFRALSSYSTESESGEPVLTRSTSYPPVPMIVIDHVDDDDPTVPPCGIPEIMITPATPVACNIPTSSPPPEPSDTDPSSMRSSEYETDVHASNDRVTVEIKQELIDLSEVGGRRQVLDPSSKQLPLIITFQCSQCGAKMTDKSVFESHMISHQTSKATSLNEGKQLSVEGGGVGCKGGVTLPDGGAMVRDGGAQKCGICAKRFASIGTLRQHLASHAELRPYVCEYCDAGFTTGQSLRIHLGTHRQERPYVCGNCGLTFAQSDDLNTHHSREHGPLEEDVQAKSQDGSTS
ncbi:uncharacterized protein LOC135502795 [Lineus longissimus]|uniref:uncharacterized protein LOC135502795 n=1 Tax=Lineus longissimus TaxID=88925 RepID=UPI00315C82B4